MLTASSCTYERDTALCVDKLNCRFRLGEDRSFGAFSTFMKSSANKTALRRAEMVTRDQSHEPLWRVLRYGRITASIIYDIVHRRTAGNSLVERVMGATSPFMSKAMSRGIRIEPKVRIAAQAELGQRIKRGLHISADNPIFAASPDGIGDDFVVEIKCPMYDRTVALYVKNGVASMKCFYQLQWQMFVCKKEMGYLVVADPKFETNKKIQLVTVPFAHSEATSMAEIALKFYEEFVYDSL